ncbi:RICIN domain-containing protein [Kitasatospora sp. cg17-2]
MPRPHERRTRSPLTLLGTLLGAVALLFTAAPVALAAPASAESLAADPASNYTCDPGTYTINTSGNSRPLTVALSSGNYGSILQYYWTNESNQKWNVCRRTASDGREIVYLKDAWRHWCMAVDRWSLQPQAMIITLGCVDENVPLNQQFWMAKVPGTNRFALQAQHSGLWISSSNHTDDILQMVQEQQPDLFYLSYAP